MKILVLGGTAWLGSRIAAIAVENGHAVTCLARGSDIPSGARLVNADRDADDALAPVTDEPWDAVIDVARQPGHVRRAVRDLEPVAESYLLISTCSVYADHREIGADEDAELLPPLEADSSEDLADYGSGKVACEQAVLEAFGPDRSLILRAGLIGGPGDPSGRTNYWPWRYARPSVPGQILIPDAPDQLTGMIDVRDLAEWTVRCAENQLDGIFDVLGPAIPFSAHLRVARAVAADFTVTLPDPVLADSAWLTERDVAPWAGPRSLPLWLPDPDYAEMNARSVARARGAGLGCRPLYDTLRDALAYRLATESEGLPIRSGLTDEEERELLVALT